MISQYSKPSNSFEKSFDWSNAVHETYKDQIYSNLFNVRVENLSYKSMSSELTEYLDFNYALDFMVGVKFPNMSFDMNYAIQARFRLSCYQSYQDIVIKETTKAGNPGELYKMSLITYFVYGYYDAKSNKLVEVFVVKVPDMLESITEDKLRTDGQIEDGRKSSACFSIKDLKDLGLIKLHMVDQNGQLEKVCV